MGMDSHMTLKVHFLFSHINFFIANLVAASYEESERLHQNIQAIEVRYQNFWNEGMICDYRWMLYRDDQRHSNKGKLYS